MKIGTRRRRRCSLHSEKVRPTLAQQLRVPSYFEVQRDRTPRLYAIGISENGSPVSDRYLPVPCWYQVPGTVKVTIPSRRYVDFPLTTTPINAPRRALLFCYNDHPRAASAYPLSGQSRRPLVHFVLIFSASCA